MNAKRVRIKMTDDAGNKYFWTAFTFSGRNVGSGRARNVKGWMFVDHEGCERFVEGNWLEVVARIRGTATNYGFVSNVS